MTEGPLDGRDRRMSGLALDVPPTIATYLGRTRFVHVLRLDLAGVIDLANDTMSARLVEAGGSLVGRTVFPYLTDPDAVLLKALLDARRSSAEPVNLNFCDAEGTPFTLLSFLTMEADRCVLIGEPTYDDEQRLRRQLIEVNEELATLARSRQRATLAEQKARLQAEVANRAKDLALAVIAHELRQPLGGAVAALSVLKQDPSAAARVQAILERQIGQMSALVEDLLSASHVMQGEIELQREVVDLRQIAQEALDLAELAAQARRQTLTLVAPDEALTVFVDRGRIRQVLGNIIANAMKYTPEGGAIVVTVERSAEAAARVRVRDTGQGMETAELDGIFGLFVRATRGGNGLGIGLAVAKRLVEVHKGTITAHSEGAGLGSEFVVTLPMVPASGPGHPSTAG